MDFLYKLKNICKKNEFQDYLIDFIFKKANNKIQAKDYKYIKISNYGNSIIDHESKHISYGESENLIDNSFYNSINLTAIIIDDSQKN